MPELPGDPADNPIGRDVLTGLVDRRVFDEALAGCVQAMRSGSQLSVALFELDHPGAVDDQRGYASGDGLLCTVAEQLRDATQAGETVARIGGASFAWLFPGAPLEAARGRVQQLIDRLANARGAGDGAEGPALSCGLAALGSRDTLASFIDRAERALRQARTEGGNRVVVRYGW